MIVFDAVRGEYVDTETGEVIEERVIDLKPDGNLLRQEGSPTTSKVHDWGLYTTIGTAKDVFTTQKMRRMQRRLRTSEKDRKLITLLSILNNESAKLGLPDYVKETASLIVRKVVENVKVGKINHHVLVIASLYYSCRVNNVPRHLQEFKFSYGIPARELWKALKLIQTTVPGLKPKIGPTDYISKIVEQLGLPQAVATKAAEIVNKVKGHVSGKSYVVLAAAAVYIASVVLDVKRTQKQIAKILKITDAGLRGRYKEIMRALGPLRYVCSNCGYELYRYREQRNFYGLMIPSEVKSMFGGVCPRCGERLGVKEEGI